jgi:LPXTG-motif cell wall-anchored protein
VGYDWNHQVSLFEALTNRRQGSVLADHWRRPRPIVIVALGVVLAAGGAWLYLRRKKQRRGEVGLRGDPRSPSALLATELYERLDGAMGAKGIGRAAGVPPLRHAEALEAAMHPLAGEVMELTDIYLRARFGGEVISDEAKVGFEERVRVIRSTALPPAQEMS